MNNQNNKPQLVHREQPPSRLAGNLHDVSGNQAVISGVGADGKLFGYIPGHYTFTWWFSNGQHNLHKDHDISPQDLCFARHLGQHEMER